MKRRNVRLIKDYLRTIQSDCAYCGKPLATIRLVTLDHVIPRSDKGPTSIHNSVLACAKCNVKKGSRYVEPTIKPPVTLESFKKFVRKMQKECPEKYWPERKVRGIS